MHNQIKREDWRKILAAEAARLAPADITPVITRVYSREGSLLYTRRYDRRPNKWRAVLNWTTAIALIGLFLYAVKLFCEAIGGPQ